jgi:hypothetical protein
MSGATGFLWMAIVILALGATLQLTGTVNLGLDLGWWLPVVLVLALLGALFNMFVIPFLGRTRTTRSSASAAGSVPSTVTTSAPIQAAAATGAVQQEVVQETRDRPSL